MSIRSWIPAVLLLLPGAALLTGCGDDDPVVPRNPRNWTVPTEITLQEAVDLVAPGDTLTVISGFPLSPVTETLVFRGGQTPLLIQGDKDRPVVITPNNITILRFESPVAGTRVASMGFSGGAIGVEATGAGMLEVEGCTFNGSTWQVSGNGSGMTVELSGNLMRNAGLYSVVLTNRARGTVSGNTIDSAGDCGILLTQTATAEVTNCIISNSVNFGIACLSGSTLLPTSGCNDVYNSGNAPYSNCTDGPDSFNQDPEFCGTSDFRITTSSPCAPENSGDCGLIGAFLPDCDPPPP